MRYLSDSLQLVYLCITTICITATMHTYMSSTFPHNVHTTTSTLLLAAILTLLALVSPAKAVDGALLHLNQTATGSASECLGECIFSSSLFVDPDGLDYGAPESLDEYEAPG